MLNEHFVTLVTMARNLLHFVAHHIPLTVCAIIILSAVLSNTVFATRRGLQTIVLVGFDVAFVVFLLIAKKYI